MSIYLKLSLCLLPFFVAQGLRAQRLTFSQRDSIKQAILETRKELKFAADIRDIEQVKVLRQVLKQQYDTTRFITLFQDEEVMISYLTADDAYVLKMIRSWYTPPRNVPYREPEPPEEDDGMFDLLLGVATLDSTQLLSAMDERIATAHERDLLKLYFRAMLSMHPNSGITEDQVANYGQTYLDAHSPSRFDVFVKKEIRRKYVPTAWGGTIGIGAGLGTFQGDLGNLLRFNVALLLNVDANYRNMVGGFRIQGGTGRIRRDFEYDNGLWERDLAVTPLYLGVYFGYKMELGPLRFTPYYDLGGTVIEVAENDRTVDNEDFSIGGFTHGPGLMLDFIPPFSWEGDAGEKFQVGLRLQGGMLFNNLNRRDPMFESTYPYVGISLMLDYLGAELDLK